MSGLLTPRIAFASAPYTASDLVGQTDPSGNPIWDSVAEDNRIMPYSGGLAYAADVEIDRVHHKLYVSENNSNDILVFNLDASNELPDRIPDYRLGQLQWSYYGAATTTQSGLSDPKGIALDVAGQRLFVADRGNNRVLIYDVSTLSNGMNASHVLGQSSFTTKVTGATQTTMNGPQSVAYDAVGQRLFVGDDALGRVLVFDASTISDGQAASYVLGKPTFSSGASCPAVIASDATNLCRTNGLAHDDNGKRLFVSGVGNNNTPRILVFDTSALSNGMAASNVLGRPDFITSGWQPRSATTLDGPNQLEYDSSSSRLIVADQTRVLFFNVSTISNGEAATNVLGQADFTSYLPVIDQSHMYFVMGTAYNPDNGKLYIAEGQHNRMPIFDINTITNGENAIDLIGQTDDTGNILWNTTSPRNANTNSRGFLSPESTIIDTAGHRMFVADQWNNRVLMFDLDSSNNLIDRRADKVLGAPDMSTEGEGGASQSTLYWPSDLAYDPDRKWLYVSEYWNNRVSVFDVATVTNGENAIYAIGQPDFTTDTYGLSATELHVPSGLAYDNVHKRLFVCDEWNDRVMVFNMTAPSNGMAASYVLGSNDFISNLVSTDDAVIMTPEGLAYDAAHNRLYVGDTYNERILVFDVTSMTNGMSAQYVIGQPDFSTFNRSTSPTAKSVYPQDLSFDPTTERLWVADEYYRILLFDTKNLANNMSASAVIGQSDFTSSIPGISQSRIEYPRGVFADPTNGRVYVTDMSDDRVLLFDTVHITAANLPNGTEGQLYNWTVTTSGAQGAISMGVTNGALPPGLSMSTSGLISGTPTKPGTYTFTTRATDDNSTAGSLTFDRTFTLTIATKPAAPASTITDTTPKATTTTTTSSATAESATPTLLNNDSDFATDSGSVRVMSSGEKVTFTLTKTSTAPSSEELHTATINMVTDTYVDLTIASEPIKLRLAIGETKDVDVDRNGSNDLSVSLLGIVNQKAQLSFRKLTPKAQSSNSSTIQNALAVPAPKNSDSKLSRIIGIVSIAVVATAFIAFAIWYRLHRPKYDWS